MTYYTKDNRIINIRRIERFEDLELPGYERGWIVDACVADIDGEQVGYLTISYIPAETFNSLYPDIWSFLVKEKHKDSLCKNPTDTLLDWYKKLSLHVYGSYFVKNEAEHYTKWTGSELNMKIRSLEQKIIKQYQSLYESFKDFHVDKPHVDFIRVFDESSTIVYGLNKKDKYPRLNHINYQRLGIASALYEDATRWMAERGLNFYASGLQEEEARAAWDKMRKQGIVKSEIHKNADNTEKVRYYLDRTSFPDSVRICAYPTIE